MDLSLFQLLYIFIAAAIGEAFGSMFGGGSFFVQPALLAAHVPPNITVANDITAADFLPDCVSVVTLRQGWGAYDR